jgi:hypothetical protein
VGKQEPLTREEEERIRKEREQEERRKREQRKRRTKKKPTNDTKSLARIEGGRRRRSRAPGDANGRPVAGTTTAAPRVVALLH